MININRLINISLILLATFFISSCGVWEDLIDDKGLEIGFIVDPDYISPYKLKIAVLPFNDEVNLGTAESGINTAKLLAKEMNRDKHVIVLPMEEVVNKIGTKSYDSSISKEEVVALGKTLDVNVIVVGSINEISKFEKRKGWRLLFKFMTEQRGYVDAVIAASAFDSKSGIMLASRASDGVYSQEADLEDYFSEDRALSPPSQEAMEGSLDRALELTRHKLANGIASLPFKAEIVSRTANEVVINSGKNVGIKKGKKFYHHVDSGVISNAIGEEYTLPGEVGAVLEVVKTEGNHSFLKIIKGSVNTGDIIQSSVL